MEFVTGDMFESGADALVNPTNCVGVMGKGLAKEFKRRFPEMFKEYKDLCDDGLILPGEVCSLTVGDIPPRFVFNFPTKKHWRDPSQLSYIEAGLVSLKNLTRYVSDRSIRNGEPPVQSVAIPAVGCGLGGLDWAVVRPMIEAEFANVVDFQVWVFEPV